MNFAVLSFAVLGLALAGPGSAATGQAAKPKPPSRAAKAARKPASAALPEATPEQLEAAQRVYYGHYACELQQAVDVVASASRPGYVEVRHGKVSYTMKPVLSSTGAIRLEDVKGRTLMVQIATKSMLMDVKAGHRLVDDCVSAKQREAIGAAEAAANAASAASAAASAASAAAGAASAAASAAAMAASAAAGAASAVAPAASQ